MRVIARTTLVALCLCAMSAPALADTTPTPTPSAAPTTPPTPSPSVSPTIVPVSPSAAAVSPRASVSASASASAPAEASSSPTASATANPVVPTASAVSTPAPSAPSGTQALAAAASQAAHAPPVAYRVDVDRLMAASSLAALVDARARLARAELDTLEQRLGELLQAKDKAETDRASFRALIDERSRLRDRLLRDALRAIAGSTPVHSASDEGRLAIEEQAALLASVDGRVERSSADAADLAATLESVSSKEDELSRLEARSRALLSGSPSSGQLAVLRDLADEASRVATTISDLLGGPSASDAAALSWSWPVDGTLTQRFGPSALTLEPPVSFQGVLFEHFHDAVDIAAPLGTAVTAPASGRVVYVGHLADGAMVVVLQHDDGFASLSAHLDDAFAPPPVHAGDRVARGDVIGYVGMTGMTTGPHLHFAVHLGGVPVDPLSVLPTRP